ncbi:hypothetical protein [Amycolatopsis magusensis]|uniref:Preprotein translocase subunit SecG n=1 Tax=Amycolatopsis magusensis TaxID=882444 RepID=A0ABS4PHA9_9PSEU|nr:hypothetical protein [Amycolatopsis magusensis]MBP2178765.1 hypothetical protein [Amycolatopsis magusensis]
MSFVLPDLAVAPVTATAVLAQQPGNGDNGGQGEDFGKSSPVGLLVLILFLIAVVLLVRSMTKHLKRVPASFDNDEEPAPASDAKPAEATPKTEAPKAETKAEPSS